ncbi:hypothetical protein [Thiococcus pfennigii]|jgi:hypothetical protein|uniref:hypothetical protein n=1 Tax=Thiococcus pfennigii TaxID=1057 RepID=UPI0019064C84|nr:hypothetical protein [Thiococcus pfennigii]MBK1701403.1 hypothetical protein [Thiococcus pfennigii]MBK1733201.1 hypothetical protein [Thiococcus pfennigii]
MSRPRFALSLSAITLFALLSGASTIALADRHDDRGRRDGPPPKGFVKYDSKYRDRYGHYPPSHHWSHGDYDRWHHRPPPWYRVPPPRMYYKSYKGYKPSAGRYRLGDGVTIILGDAKRR